ncbi:hypothetical protein DUI87_09822 [Hirundo rustica rustica]|uniref:Uncharacterized protein n=1 Tax=Hirundo rustica rustica TaxID=333673 RepID=A0A3M0KGE6_HIRRU|nr:hypothetical protein DUI87_09822 [Hirundo rustica rustica]
MQQADLEFAKLKEMTKCKLFSQKSLKCAGAWAVWLVAKSLAEEKQAAQVEIQNLREENKKLKEEIKALQLKLEEGITREGAVAMEQVRSALQYQEMCEQKKAILNENQALKEKVAISTKAVEEAQGTIQLLVQKIQTLKERGTDHRACEVKMEKLKAALEAKHGAVTAPTPHLRVDEHWDGEERVNPDGSPSTETRKPANPQSVVFERSERFKANPVSLPRAPVAGKRETGIAEQGSGRNLQPPAEGVITEGTSTAPRQFKPRSTQGRTEQSAGSVRAKEDREGGGTGRGSRGRENSRDMRAPDVLQTAASAGVTPQSPFVGRGRKGRWQGKRQWQYGAAPRFVVQNAVARRELSTMREDIWRELRRQGEDMARWDNAPTRVLLDRLLEITGRREGSEPRAPALPVIA